MAPFQQRAGSNADSGGEFAGPYDELSRGLSELPRPRAVRFSRRGKIFATIVSAALLASLGIYAVGMAATSTAAGRNAGPPQFPIYALSIAFVVVVALVMVNALARQKRLLAEGEIAAAHVTKRWIARNGPNIRYEFTTPLGEHFSRSAADSTRQLALGMNVPIFYNPQNPKKQLALCASFYDLVLPGAQNVAL